MCAPSPKLTHRIRAVLAEGPATSEEIVLALGDVPRRRVHVAIWVLRSMGYVDAPTVVPHEGKGPPWKLYRLRPRRKL